MKLPLKELQKRANNYFEFTDAKRAVFLKQAYNKHELSWPQIAKMCGTYPNKIRRDAVKLGIRSREQSEAQSISLKKGVRKHPTEGTKRSEETKLKGSEGMAKNWDKMSKKDRKLRSEQAKELWDQKTDAEKEDFNRKAGDAVRESAKTGSKLEKYLAKALMGKGYKVELHKKHLIKNDNVHIDLYLPRLSVAIEVDGISHEKPVWGRDTLQRTKRTDANKDGLLLGSGFCVIRIKQTKSLSQKYQRDILAGLLQVLKGIKNKFPPRNKRRIILDI